MCEGGYEPVGNRGTYGTRSKAVENSHRPSNPTLKDGKTRTLNEEEEEDDDGCMEVSGKHGMYSRVAQVLSQFPKCFGSRHSLSVVVMCSMYVGVGVGMGCIAIFLKIFHHIS